MTNSIKPPKTLWWAMIRAKTRSRGRGRMRRLTYRNSWRKQNPWCSNALRRALQMPSSSTAKASPPRPMLSRQSVTCSFQIGFFCCSPKTAKKLRWQRSHVCIHLKVRLSTKLVWPTRWSKETVNLFTWYWYSRWSPSNSRPFWDANKKWRRCAPAEVPTYSLWPPTQGPCRFTIWRIWYIPPTKTLTTRNSWRTRSRTGAHLMKKPSKAISAIACPSLPSSVTPTFVTALRTTPTSHQSRSLSSSRDNPAESVRLESLTNKVSSRCGAWLRYLATRCKRMTCTWAWEQESRWT